MSGSWVSECIVHGKTCTPATVHNAGMQLEPASFEAVAGYVWHVPFNPTLSGDNFARLACSMKCLADGNSDVMQALPCEDGRDGKGIA
jgi:hypothetical protein